MRREADIPETKVTFFGTTYMELREPYFSFYQWKVLQTLRMKRCDYELDGFDYAFL
jgi:hypothetical protein